MDSTVIVALPPVDDKVNRISSEKIPHLTLLFLGDQANSDALPGIVEYVQHAASQLAPFGLTVDHRGVLGPESADVLFFEDSPIYTSRIKDFRHHLLLNDAIKRAYDSQEQFPEWIPHLTLGYPETPANEDNSDYPGIHHVQFDRIAVWMGDFQGPEFRLKYDDHAMEAKHQDQEGVAMSDMSFADLGEKAAGQIFHYGVKGMKWGVTKVDRAAQPTLIREKKSLRNTKDVTVTQRKAGTYVKTRGGKRQKATDDAVKAAAARQKAKKSTTDALTNDELRAAVERMNLEQQYHKLDAKTKRRGQGFISKMFMTKEGRKTTADLAKRAAAIAVA